MSNLNSNMDRLAEAPHFAASWLIGPLMLGVCCCLGQHLSFALRVPPKAVSTIWLPGGFLLAALLLVPPRRWPTYLTCAFGALALAYAPDEPLGVVVVFLSVLFTCITVAAAIVRNLCVGIPSFEHFRHTMFFVLLACIASPIAVGCVGAMVTVWGGIRDDFWSMWLRMGLTAAMGTLMTPLVLIALASPRRLSFSSISKTRCLEGSILTLGLVSVGLVFGGEWSSQMTVWLWLLYLPLPLLIWSAVRFGPGTTSAAAVVLILISTWFARQGRGPFVAGPSDVSVISLQISMLAMTFPNWLLATAIRELRNTANALLQSEAEARQQLAQLENVYRTVPIGLAFIDSDQTCRRVNDRFAEFNGQSPESQRGQSLAQMASPALTGELESMRQVVNGEEKGIDEHEIRTSASNPTESERIWLVGYYPVCDDRDDLLGMSIVVREITERKRVEASLRQSNDQIKDLAGRLIAAQEAERSRIACELHDDINQRLAALAIRLSSLKRRVAEMPAVVAEVGRLQQAVVDLTQDIRVMSHDLHPGVLQHAGLLPALEARCLEIRKREGLNLTLVPVGSMSDIPPDVALCVYRVAQEALQNIVRHANASNVRIDLIRFDAAIDLCISDDGCGFDVSDRGRQDGIGLLSMDERVRLLHGSLQVESKPGCGTSLRVIVPMGGIR